MQLYPKIARTFRVSDPEEKMERFIKMLMNTEREMIIVDTDLGFLEYDDVKDALLMVASPIGFITDKFDEALSIAEDGRYEDAIPIFEKGIEALHYLKRRRIRNKCLKSIHANILNNIGYCQLKVGRLRESEKSLKRALRFDRNTLYAHNNLGTVYEYVRKYSKAIKMYEKELELNPDHPTAAYNLERVRSLI